MKLPTCKKLMKDPESLVHFFREYHPAIVKIVHLYALYARQRDLKLVDQDGNPTAITNFAEYVRLNLDKLP